MYYISEIITSIQEDHGLSGQNETWTISSQKSELHISRKTFLKRVQEAYFFLSPTPLKSQFTEDL